MKTLTYQNPILKFSLFFIENKLRYFITLGFSHSTFAFQTESSIHKTGISAASVKPGALINLIQKGLQYIQVEYHINEVKKK